MSPIMAGVKAAKSSSSGDSSSEGFTKKSKRHSPRLFGLSTGGPLGMGTRAAVSSGLKKRRRNRRSNFLGTK